MLNTAEYNLAKWLDGLIKPHIPATHSLNSTFEFVERLKGYTFTGNEILCSFDVESLFTNVPLAETIELVTQYVYDSDPSRFPFERKHFVTLLEKATSGMFLYKDKLYRQTDTFRPYDNQIPWHRRRPTFQLRWDLCI